MKPAHFVLCRFGNVLYRYTLSCVGFVVILDVFRNLNITDEAVVDYNTLGAILAGGLRFVNINIQQYCIKKKCLAIGVWPDVSFL